MPDIFEYDHTVRDEELDSIGRANNVAYVNWMQSAALAHSAAQGWPDERYLEFGQGWVARSHYIEYLQAAMADDQIVVRTWIATMKKVTSLRRYHILRKTDQTLLAKAETNWAFINFATGSPKRIPPQIARSFQVVADEIV